MCQTADRTAYLQQAMLGNESAVQFLGLMWNIAHTWDDLIDRDKPVTEDKINQVFTDALLVLPRNPFYAQYFDYLYPLVANSITNWRIATDLERSDGVYGLRIAYILRSSYADLITQCATLIGGHEHGLRVGHEARLMAHREGWDGYLKNLAAEKTARELAEKKE